MGFDYAYINAILCIVAGNNKSLHLPRANGEPYVPDFNVENVKSHIQLVRALKRHLFTTPAFL